MKATNQRKAWIIFIFYVIATCALLLCGYSVQKPAVQQQEFPFTITYSYQGEVETISDVYVGEYVRHDKYIGDNSIAWYGYVKDRDRLQADFYRIAEDNGAAFSINLNIDPGYLMGDPSRAGIECAPELIFQSFDGTNEIVVTDPTELEEMGFSLVRYTYPTPIENRFSYGGVSLSSEATIFTSAIAVVALLVCLIVVKKDSALIYGKLDKFSVVLNFVVMLVAFPFILAVGVLSEIVSDASAWQQVLYLIPALTVVGVGASVVLRRLGCKQLGFWIQLIAPAIFSLFAI